MYQLEEAVSAVGIELDEDEIKLLEEKYRPKVVKGIFGNAKARSALIKKLESKK